MKIRFFNLYYLFFSIALSAAVFPSTLGNYFGFIIPLGFATFVLDELILLTSVVLMLYSVVTVPKISHKIGGYGSFLVAFLIFLVGGFALSWFRADNSLEIISRDRWIALNSFALLMPFVYKPNMHELRKLYKHFAVFMGVLTTTKLSCFVVLGPEFQLSQFGPGFLFMLSLCLAIYLWSDESLIKKCICSFIVLLVSIFGEQMSAILLALMCICIPIYFSFFKSNILAVISLSFLGLIAFFLLISINLTDVALAFKLNPLNFTIVDKLLIYLELWTAPFVGISPIEFFLGRGAGYSTEIFAYNEFLDTYTLVKHSLAHNFLVTLFMKFGLMGLIFFLAVVFSIFTPISRKFDFEDATLLKLLLFLMFFNFFSTPGIWKIRKGIFLWFVVGLCYFYRRYRVTENV